MRQNGWKIRKKKENAGKVNHLKNNKTKTLSKHNIVIFLLKIIKTQHSARKIFHQKLKIFHFTS